MSVTRERVCATRKSRKFPNVFLQKELRKLALEEGYSQSTIDQLSKRDLCGLLGIDWYQASDYPTKPRRVKPMTRRKVCGTRKSKKLPNVYTRKELEELARERGYSPAEIRKMSKLRLCGLLGIDWYVTHVPDPDEMLKPRPARSRAPRPPPSDEGVLFYEGRPCNVRRSTYRPDAFLKDELVEIAMEKYELTKSQARKMTKKELCELLGGDETLLAKVRSKPSPSKDELVELVSEKYGMAKSELEKLRVADLKKMLAADVRIMRAPEPVPKTKPRQPTKDELIKKVAAKYEMSEARLRSKTKGELKKMLDADVRIIKREPEDEPVKDESCIERSKLRLDPHQADLVRYIRGHRGAIANWATGAGKTLMAVTASQCVLDDHPDWEVIVVAPKSLKGNFAKELEKYGADPNDDRYIYYTYEGFRLAYRDKKQKCGPKTFIIFDEAHKMRSDVSRLRNEGKKRYEKALAEYNAGRRAKKPIRPFPGPLAGLECAKNAGKILLLTATSIYNNPYDVENLVAMIKGREPITEKQFELLVARAQYAPNIFNKHFDCIFSFYDRPDSDEYPDFEEHIVEIKMTNKYYREYRKVETQNSLLFDRQKNPMAFLGGVRQATNALEPPQKVAWVMKKLREDRSKKTVIFSAFKNRGIQLIKDRLDKAKIPYEEISGDITSIKKREEAASKFSSPEGPNVLLITSAGGEGIDLKGVRTVIILETTWNRANELQVIGRAVRKRSHTHLPKDEQRVDIYHLVLVKPDKTQAGDFFPSADTRLREIVEEKTGRNTEFENLLRGLDIAREVCKEE